ncbi:MAG: response regulator [Chloroflexi bacterium]|nr:response regulator [Chloroflexota bacterium]
MSNPLALIIEDDIDLANIFAEAVQNADFEVESIQDGKQALTRLTSIVPAVVVLDLHLPHVDGEQILSHIRADRRLTQTRIIVATADPVKADALAEQADLVLIKPISFSQLRDMAKRLRLAVRPD